MTSGRLRVLLGAAPGVGKTVAMLEEGRTLAEAGRDVVVAVVETHGRERTSAAIGDLHVLPRAVIEHRGVTLTELDLPAVLTRAPAVALVDELAHTNAPGSSNAKRWQDVETILAAGIDVITTVNIQHIESLNDVVEQITGAAQRETVPDAVLRAAAEIEVVDLTPEALRERLAQGHVYPAERIDAALANYFRLGNLTALRELALLWLADEVDSALTRYRAEQGIEHTWETRERVVVTLTGGPEGDTLIRRAARIAARTAGGELLAVHVLSQDGLRPVDPAALSAQRALVESLGGSYHQVVGDDVADTLIEFARSVNATQLVLGVSSRGRIAQALTGPGIGQTVIRGSGNIDVHIVNHAAAARGRSRLPSGRGALSARRRVLGFVLAAAGGPGLTWFLVTRHTPDSITSDVLSYQLLVVVVALTGGVWPALFAALLSGVTLDYFFIDPKHTVTISEPQHVLAIVLYVLIAALVSVVVDRAARQARAARRAAAEAELLATVSGSVLRGQEALPALLERTREAFGLSLVRVLSGDTVIAEQVAPEPERASPAAEVLRLPAGDRAELELTGGGFAASERRLLSVIAAQVAQALQHQDLSETVSELDSLEETDRVRTALLSAVSHDLRRPLAAATAAVGGLRTAGNRLNPGDREELLATAEESLGTLATLVTDLLDVSRLEVGAVAVALSPTDPADVILPALDELGFGPGQVTLDLREDAGPVLADPALLQRVLVNLLANAERFTPPGERIRLSTSAFAGQTEIRVVDHGPGIAPERRDAVFEPFQRRGDTDNTAGLGLGLALSRGFAEGMGGSLTAEDTPGGGLTMVVTLPRAEEAQ